MVASETSQTNMTLQNGFLMQIVCLTIAPAFMAAGIYLCLSRIVITFGAENSRIRPLSYPRIFIPCDVASLLLQAAGGGIASAQTHANKNPAIGDHLMIAGLAFQVFTLLIFMCLSLDFALRTLKRAKSMGDEAFDPVHSRLRQSWSFKAFLIALSISTVCIFIRSVYRVVELSEGWSGALIKNQTLFMILEGMMVIIAVLLLNVFHPGLCFGEGDSDKARSMLNPKSAARKEKKRNKKAMKAEKQAEADEKGIKDTGASSPEV